MACDAMRVLHRDPKTGEIKVRVENADDLWHLHNLVLPGDLVRASTYRREEVKTDKVRPERGEKVRVTLTIRVESVEFQAFSDRLRITGVIVEGPQDLGRHHTLNVAVDDVLSVIKTWRSHELRRIDEAVAAAQKPLVAFLSLDDEEALVAQLRQYGVHELATIHAPGHGKMFPSGDARSVFFDDILTKLRMTPIGEALLVERRLEAMATDKPCAYGPAEVGEAVDAGAVETLLVSDAVVRDPGVEEMMRAAESARGTVVLISRHHEAGQKLEALGGIAALLRFPIK